MRILHVTEAVGAGVESAITQYVRSTPEFSHVVLAPQLAVERVGGNEDVPWEYVDGVFRLAQVLRRRAAEFDLVHLHSSVAGAVGRAVVDRTKSPVVYSPHALAFLNTARRGRSLFRAVERLLVGRPVAFGAVSTHEADVLVSLGARRRDVVIVPHAISAAPRVRSFSERRPVVVGVGRIAWQKDPALFATVAHEAADGPLAELSWTWMGGGEAPGTAALEGARVHVRGWVASSEVGHEMSAALAVLHTARYEGLPISLIEAMALGTPVVARRIPALAGLPLISFNTSAEAVDAICRLRDRDEWTAVAEAARSHVSRHFSRRNQADALRGLYSMAAAS